MNASKMIPGGVYIQIVVSTLLVLLLCSGSLLVETIFVDGGPSHSIRQQKSSLGNSSVGFFGFFFEIYFFQWSSISHAASLNSEDLG